MPETGHLRPRDIAVDRANHELRIEWDDRHTSTYQFDILREACPCATCRGGHEFMGPEHDPDLIQLTPVRRYEVVSAQLVGSYALQIGWSDQHSAGIYTWDYLRRICPCPACQAERSRQQPPAE
jgi:DUF971 family protein